VTRTNFFCRSVPRKVAIDGVELRPGTVEDAPAMLRLMDIATDWLVKKGQTGQWGTERHSDNPARIKQATEKAESGGTWIAVDTNSSSSRTEDGLSGGEVESPSQSTDKSGGKDEELSIINGVVGALTVGQANPYVQPATEPELYVQFLASDRASSGKGIGTLLLEQARTLARKAGVSLLRVDCYAGGSGGLVRYYESQGFERMETFEINGWPGQVLIQRLDKDDEPES
jgi:GNAT superfamily N-acetyltransferase